MKALAMSAVMAGVLGAAPAMAGPVVREGSGANAAAIQAVVDQFRADLGGANNGNTPGTQPLGRREINWDGGGATAPLTLDPIPMTRFSARGARFVTTGSGFAISGLPLPEFGELNGAYPTQFAAFSSPRLFTALNSNELDVEFHVPGDLATPAGVTAFGAVFTDVDSATSTKLQFFTPDGVLLYERFVPAAAGSETLSFLGVSFNAGEVVGRVRIVSGNAALGATEAGAVDVVAMDDFIYAEPVATAGLTHRPGVDDDVPHRPVRPGAGHRRLRGAPGDRPHRLRRPRRDGQPPGLPAPRHPGRGGVTFRCALPGSLLSAGDHSLNVELGFADGSRRRNAIRWAVVANTEP